MRGEFSIQTESYPVILNLETNQVWFPPSRKPFLRSPGILGSPLLPRWSPHLGGLLASETAVLVGIYDVDGNLIRNYEGNLLGVSPSATKIMMDDTWVDLISGQKVKFDWDRPLPALQGPTIWSQDETQVYICCYLYGNARTGAIVKMLGDNGFTVDGKTEDFFFYHSYGNWVFNDKYMMVQWQGLFDGTPGLTLLFDPEAKTYRNLNAAAGIPYDLNQEPMQHPCDQAYVQANGRYVWINCLDGSHLVDLATFKSETYPDYLFPNIDWSPDGSFALITPDDNDVTKILSGASKKMEPLPNGWNNFGWHLTKNVLISLSQGHILSLLDVQTMSIQKEITLPVEFQSFSYNMDGTQIILIAKDNSLWQVNYPNLNNLQQLTVPIRATDIQPGGSVPFIQNMTWSSDGAFLAFQFGSDIYLVDTKAKKP